MLKIYNTNFEAKTFQYTECGVLKEISFEEANRQCLILAKELQVKCLHPTNPFDLFHFYDTLLEYAANEAKNTKFQSEANLIPCLIGKEDRKIIVEYSDGEIETFYLRKTDGWFPEHRKIKEVLSTVFAPIRRDIVSAINFPICPTHRKKRT